VTQHVHQRTGRTGFFIPRTEDQSPDPAVHHRAGAHHARLQRHIQRSIKQAIVLQHQTALAKRHDFGMCSRIVAANRTVPPFTNHLVIVDQHGTYGHFALVPGTLSQRQRMAHPVFMVEFRVGQRLILQSKSGRHYTRPLWIRLFELLEFT